VEVPFHLPGGAGIPQDELGRFFQERVPGLLELLVAPPVDAATDQKVMI
jgi:hypothetical protein